jgi:hypothetical protein
MFCEHCGAKKEENEEFCHNCGKKAGEETAKNLVMSVAATNAVNKDVFYSEDWRQKKVFALTALPHCDVMIDGDFLYIIKMPNYSGGAWGFFVGLFILNIIGAAIGSSIGQSSDKKKRGRLRTGWLNSQQQLISNDYSPYLLVKIPLAEIGENTIFGKKRFTVSFEGKVIVLQKGQSEFDRLKSYLEKYVL